MLCYLVIGDGEIGAGDVPLEGDVDVDKHEVLVGKHGLKLLHRDVGVVSASGGDLLADLARRGRGLSWLCAAGGKGQDNSKYEDEDELSVCHGVQSSGDFKVSLMT